MIFSSRPASSSISSAPTGRQRTIAPGHHLHLRNDQHVARIAVGRQCLRDEAIIPRIKHGGVQEAIDHERPRRLVELVFRRRAAERDLDDRVDVLGRIGTNRNRANVHANRSEAPVAGLEHVLCVRLQGKNRSVARAGQGLSLRSDHRHTSVVPTRQITRSHAMGKEENNKAVVGRWFTEFWGKRLNLGVVDEIAAPDMLLKYSLHEPRRGRDDIKAFMTDFRAAFPDLNFWGTADLIAEGDYVVGQWEGGASHTGPAFNDFLVGGLPAATGRKMHFTGTTVLKVLGGKIVEEIGLDDGVTALTQLGLIRASRSES